LIKLGDYVLATKGSDGDPCDPWRVGFVCRIIHTWKRNDTYIIGEANGTWTDFREYEYVRVIIPDDGAHIIEERIAAEKAVFGGVIA